MPKYEIIHTEPTVYQEQGKGVINGFLVQYRMLDYDEVHEVRIPKMDAALAQKAIEKAIAERDAMASLGK